MDPTTIGVIAGGMGTSLLGNILGQQNAQKQMDFQERMSGTAHQRETGDLRNAGLNPLLSALGSGAPGAPGASAGTPDLNGLVSTGANSAIAMKQQKIAETQMGKDFEAKDAQIANTKMDTHNKDAERALIENQARATAKDIENKTYSNTLLKETLGPQIKKAKAEGDYSEINQIMGIINSGASSAGQLINPFKGMFTPSKGRKP